MAALSTVKEKEKESKNYALTSLDRFNVLNFIAFGGLLELWR